MNRRDFMVAGFAAISGMAMSGCSSLAVAEGTKRQRRWRKGQLHCHTVWSDGNALPETALALYRAAGFDFVCISDHDMFPTMTDHWVQIEKESGPWPGRLSEDAVAQAEKFFPGEVETRSLYVRRFARLKTHAELARRFNETDKFLVVPGVEVARMCHMNVFNVAADVGKDLPRISSDDFSYPNVSKAARGILGAYRKFEKPDDRSFLQLNHPYWSKWDVDPRVMLEIPELGLWEVCNSGAEAAPKELDIEKAWDFVLAHRLANGGKLVYGTATDDAHCYQDDYRGQHCGLEGGWVVVDCPETMTADRLSQAIARGEFYASCGVEVEDFGFDRATRTLTVKARPRPGEKLRIDFITTKRDFDRSIVERRVRAQQVEDCFRTLPMVNDTIGRVVKSVDGPEGSYTLASDDLYARAVVVSDRPSVNRMPDYPETHRAWIQPVVA